MAVENGMKVMVAIDESGSIYHAFIWAVENLKESINVSGNPLVIFMANPSPSNSNIFAASLGIARMHSAISASHAPEFVTYLQEQNKAVSLGILEKAKSICISHGINAETIAEIGDPKQTICDAVEKYNISLLVVGDHELGRFNRVFIGSVSDYCVQYSKCPVLVVKKPE